MERLRQFPKHHQITVAYHGNLNVADATFGPRSPKTSDRTLSGVAESHLRVNDQVIEMVIAIEINRQRVSVSMVVAKRLPMFILPCQFWAVNAIPVAHLADDCAVEQLRLRECAGAVRQG